MKIAESLYIDFITERARIIDLIEHDSWTAVDEDNSYNDMLDRIDEHYRGKAVDDNSLDIFDIRNIVNLMDESEDDNLVDVYSRVAEYLDGKCKTRC